MSQLLAVPRGLLVQKTGKLVSGNISFPGRNISSEDEELSVSLSLIIISVGEASSSSNKINYILYCIYKENKYNTTRKVRR